MSKIDGKTPHFVIIPFLSQGHMIPLMDIAKLLSKHGVLITVLTTPQNASRFRGVIERAVLSGLEIRIHHLVFPSSEVGLPEECDNCDLLPSVRDMKKFLIGVDMLKTQVEESVLPRLDPAPNCLIADSCFSWASDVARKFQIPKLTFIGASCFSAVCSTLLARSEDFEALASPFEYFAVPGLPHRIEITKAQQWGSAVKYDSYFSKAMEQILQSIAESFGIIANTVEDLESEYVEEYKKLMRGKKLWCVGPVSVCNEDGPDKAERGNKAAVEETQILKWLDSKEPRSVIFVCLGSILNLPTSQMRELGLALEASNRPFVWVIVHASEELDAWMAEEKLEEKVKGRGFLIRGWAPQVLILSHPSVGAFMTHCGWNSTLEGITAGLPMITWPSFSDQFHGEKLIVDVIRTGVRIGVEVPTFGTDDAEKLIVGREEIGIAIDRLMGGGEEAEERRKRAEKLGEIVKRAHDEGGSSSLNVKLLIQDVMSYQQR